MGALSERAAASRCHSSSGCMQWDSKYKTYTHSLPFLPSSELSRWRPLHLLPNALCQMRKQPAHINLRPILLPREG